MSGEPLITIVGNATADCELRFTPSGAAVGKFTVAVTPRVKKNDSWVDGTTVFYRCTTWREMAEQCAESITKGMRLLVYGRLTPREYEKDGVTRLSLDLEVDEVGPSLRYATAKVHKMSRSSEQNSRASTPRGGGDSDPWASQSGERKPGFGGQSASFDVEPPPF